MRILNCKYWTQEMMVFPPNNQKSSCQKLECGNLHTRVARSWSEDVIVFPGFVDLGKSAGYRGPIEETCFFFIIIYFWLCWVFVAAQEFSSCEEWDLLSSCGVEASHCGGFSCSRGQALGDRAWVVATHRLSSCGSQAREHRVSSWSAGAQLLCGRWGLARLEIEPVSPALAGRFVSSVPPGKSHLISLWDDPASVPNISHTSACFTGHTALHTQSLGVQL